MRLGNEARGRLTAIEDLRWMARTSTPRGSRVAYGRNSVADSSPGAAMPFWPHRMEPRQALERSAVR